MNNTEIRTAAERPDSGDCGDEYRFQIVWLGDWRVRVHATKGVFYEQILELSLDQTEYLISIFEHFKQWLTNYDVTRLKRIGEVQ